jgi:hypothetical protein
LLSNDDKNRKKPKIITNKNHKTVFLDPETINLTEHVKPEPTIKPAKKKLRRGLSSVSIS